MSQENKKNEKLKRRIAGLEKTLRIVVDHSGRTEESLKNLFNTVSNTIPVPLMIASKDGKILFSNKKAREIFGYSNDLIYQIRSLDLYENPEDRNRLLKIIACDGEVRDFGVCMKKSDGSVFPASLFSQQIIFEGHTCLLTVTYDLSELKQEEEKRLTLERQLRQNRKMEAIGTMAGGIAHDFNNILTIILGKTELAMEILSTNSSAAKNQLNDVVKAVDRARKMVRQILDFSRKTAEVFKPFEITEVISETAQMIQMMTLPHMKLKLRMTSEPSVIMGDSTQIQQVLINLCTNAVYALRDRQTGIMEIILENVFFDSEKIFADSCLSAGWYARLTISDNGTGIDKNIIERIFDPFFTTKAVGEGTGMGLAVIHGIIQRHGGAVNVESKLGKGTAFHCHIPLASEINSPDCLAKPAPPKIDKCSKEHILLVDDEKEIVDICSQYLQCMGYYVTTMTDSAETLKLFQKNPDWFDLLITDETMPKMSGKELSAKVLKIRPELPVILITGKDVTDIETSQTGFKALVHKPFTGKDIKIAVQSILNKNQETGNE